MEDNKPEENTFNMSANIPSSKSLKHSKGLFSLKWLLILIMFVVYSAILTGVTYFITTAINERNLKGVLNAFHNSNSPLFLNLTGIANGKIVEIKSEKAWVETGKGGKLILSITEPVTVSEISGGKLTELGTTIDKIKLNQNAVIKVSGYGSGYIITSVTYINDSAPNLVPEETASVSAKQARPSAKIKN